MTEKALKTALGEQVRAIRLARGLTQEQLADKLGVTVRYYAGLERGERNFTLDSVEMLAEQLGATATLRFEAEPTAR